MSATGSTTLNGWAALSSATKGAFPRLRKFSVPLRGGDTPNPEPRTLTLRDGSAGFLLVHMASWWHDDVERLDIGVWDDWGYNYRPGRGLTGLSNHAGGTAMDLNATRHPHHVPILRTFIPRQVAAIRHRLRLYQGVLDWGGDWSPEWIDGMHVEVSPGANLSEVERVARRLMSSPRGQEVLEANPGLKAVILS